MIKEAVVDVIVHSFFVLPFALCMSAIKVLALELQ